MDNYNIIAATTDKQLQEVATLASHIWHEHFIPIIGETQVDYMLDRFQSFPALKAQIDEGYEYFQIYSEGRLSGYTGIHAEKDALFLSKLYIKKEARGRRISSLTLEYLIQLCKNRGINRIWLTCNKYNASTLSVYDHMGFQQIDSQVADIGNGYVMDDYILGLKIV